MAEVHGDGLEEGLREAMGKILGWVYCLHQEAES